MGWLFIYLGDILQLEGYKMRKIVTLGIIVLTLLCSCTFEPDEEYICEPRIGIYNNGKTSFYYEIVKDSPSFTGHLGKMEGSKNAVLPVEMQSTYYMRIYQITSNDYTLVGDVVEESAIVSMLCEFSFTAIKALNYIQVYNDNVILIQENSVNDSSPIRTTIN